MTPAKAQLSVKLVNATDNCQRFTKKYLLKKIYCYRKKNVLPSTARGS